MKLQERSRPTPTLLTTSRQRDSSHKRTSEPTAEAAAAAADPAGGARVLVLVRDEHTCTQIRQHSALGGPIMMRRRFLQ